MTSPFNPKTCGKCGAWSQRIVARRNGIDLLRCDHCGTRDKAKPFTSYNYLSRTHKNKYPYLSGSLGEVVTSRDHEEHVAKSLGMVPMEHQRVKTQKRTYRNKATKARPPKQSR